HELRNHDPPGSGVAAPRQIARMVLIPANNGRMQFVDHGESILARRGKPIVWWGEPATPTTSGVLETPPTGAGRNHSFGVDHRATVAELGIRRHIGQQPQGRYQTHPDR